MTLGATLTASFLAALARPATWILALAAFLLRGGVVFVLAPIVVIPSAVGFANILAPAITTVVFDGGAGSLAVLIGGIGLATLAWLVAGGVLAALAEAELIRWIAADEDVLATVGQEPGTVAGEDATRPARPGGLAVAWRVLAVRLIALVPLAVVLAWGSTRLVGVAYRELTVPSDVTTPIAVRVLRDAPEAVVAILIAWVVGETVGALAARWVVLRADPIGRALRQGVVRLVRHPVRSLVLGLGPLLALVLVAVPSALAASTAWQALRAELATGGGALLGIGVLLLFVALWLGGLVLIGAISAWRSAVWTVDVAGTFGAIDHGRQGDWNHASESGTLTDLRSRGVDPDTR